MTSENIIILETVSIAELQQNQQHAISTPPVPGKERREKKGGDRKQWEANGRCEEIEGRVEEDEGWTGRKGRIKGGKKE